MQKVLVALLAVVVLGGTGWAWVNYDERVSGAASPRVDRINDTPASTIPDEDSETVVTVLGDSFVTGSDMNDGPTWTELLAEEHGWIVVPLAAGGTGYANASALGEAFPARVADVANYQSDLIILAGGINDSAQPDDAIREGATQTVERAKELSPSADILMLSAFANGDPNEAVSRVSAVLREVAVEQGVEWLDVTGFLAGERAKFIGSDGTHPTNQGHRTLAKQIGAGLSDLGLPRRDAYDPAG